MKIAVLGSTGRTGRLLVEELLRRDHQVTAVVRDAARAPAGVTAVVADVTDAASLGGALAGVEAVVSALGPVGADPHLHQRTSQALVAAMTQAGVRRFVGISGAGVDAPGDRKRPRDRVISKIMTVVSGGQIRDKTAELAAFAASDLDWTLVRPPRLTTGAATGQIESDPHVSTRSTAMSRADLAVYLVDVVEQGLHVRLAPFAAGR